MSIKQPCFYRALKIFHGNILVYEENRLLKIISSFATVVVWRAAASINISPRIWSSFVPIARCKFNNIDLAQHELLQTKLSTLEMQVLDTATEVFC